MKIIPRLGALLLGLFSALAQADSAQLIRNQPLLAEPSANSPVLTQLERSTPIELLQRQGGWVKVRASNREGWVRLLSIRRDAQKGARLADMIGFFLTPRAEQINGRVSAVAGLRTLPQPKSSAHALILTIGDYRNGIPQLKGVRFDADAAVMMANGMGVPNDNITVLHDEALTLDGLRQAFDGLNQRVAAGDQVFIYYSGHGARLATKESEGERCAEALVSVDGQVMLDSELETKLRQLAGKVRRVVSFFDASHSGGMAPRGNGEAEFTPKFWAPPGQAVCDKPSNALDRLVATRAIGAGSGNFVHITSARADEISLDEPKRGGIATRAWLDCLGGEATDTDASGGLSVTEIQTCAQKIVNTEIAQSKSYPPLHITVNGNQGMVFGIAAGAGPKPVSAPTTAAPGHSAPVPTVVGAIATLQDMYENRDDRRHVEFRPMRNSYRINKDRVGFTLTSSHPGYVSILMVGSDGSSFDMLFPNRKDTQNFVRAGETLVLPRAGWDIVAGGPPGQDRLLAIVSDTPRDFSKLGMRPAGPFSSLDAKKSGATNDIQLAVGASENSASAQCNPSGRTRALSVIESCSDAYGAALLTIVEVE